MTYVCGHLAGDAAGLGFHCDEPSEEEPCPDAWCDDCELIRAAYHGWTDDAQDLTGIAAICEGCYQMVRIRHTRTAVTLDELAGLRWRCGSCEQWHTGPVLDLGFDRPSCWPEDWHRGRRWTFRATGALDRETPSFLDGEYCAIDNASFFVRGVIPLPVIGSLETFHWGVWGTLSRANFEFLLRHENNPAIEGLPPMSSWLGSSLPDYPETLHLPMQARMQAPGYRPEFHLEEADHPLAKEQRLGISPERVREITLRRVPREG